MDEKVFNHSNYHSKDDANVKYSHAKRLDGNGVLFSGVHYLEDNKKHRILYEFQSASLELYNGKVKFFLDESLQEFIEGLDELNMGRVYENSKKWFDKSFDYDKVDRWYSRPIITKSKRGNFVLCRSAKDIKVEDTKNRKLNLEDITSECVVQIEFTGLEFYKENIVPVYLLNSVICRAKNGDVIDSQGEESGISSNEETDSSEHLEEVEVESLKQEEHKEVSEPNEIKTKTLEREQLVLESKDEFSLYNEESCVFNETARRQIEIELEKIRESKMSELREKRKQHREKSKELSNSHILEN
jgi:hypothetical protein